MHRVVYSDQEGHQLTSGNAAPGVTTLPTLCSLPSAGMAMAMKMAMAGNVQSQLPAGSDCIPGAARLGTLGSGRSQNILMGIIHRKPGARHTGSCSNDR